jgi:eukaryotic-like serine/threonine-protein kinase
VVTVADRAASRVIGRYAIHEEIASGGMATVYLGRLDGTGGFSRNVAIKRLHAHLAKDPEFVRMFLDEARIAARIRHPNVVPVLDVVNTGDEIFLVMEYVAGESLARLARGAAERGERMPVAIAAAVVVGVLRGLHAAHEATDEQGQPLCIVHRDVSPQNIIVGRDGAAHLLDFGVAKAAGQLQTSRNGRIKGKVSYMPPEQARGAEVTRAVDVYAAGVILWELLTGERLFPGDNEGIVLERVLFGEVAAPSHKAGPAELDEVVMRAISRDPLERFPTAREMARAVEAAVSVAGTSEVSEWLESHSPPPRAPSLPGVVAVEAPQGGDPGSGVRPASATSVQSRSSPARPWSQIAVATLVVALASGVALLAVHRIARGVPSPITPATVTAAPSAPPPPSVSVIVPPPAEAAASSSSPAMPAPRPTVRPAARSGREGCNPPYTVGSDGVKQYKVQCL